MIKAILATSLDSKVGSSHTKSGLPWEHGTYPEDMKYFKDRTLNTCVVYGNNTYKTLSFVYGLKGRHNYVVTSEIPELSELGFRDVYINFDEGTTCRIMNMNFLRSLFVYDFNRDYWIIGGVSIYKQLAPQIEEFHITRISDSYPDADVEFNVDGLLDEHGFSLVESTPLSDKCTVEVWRK